MGYQVCQDVEFVGHFVLPSTRLGWVNNHADKGHVEEVCGKIENTADDAYVSFSQKLDEELSHCSIVGLFWRFDCSSAAAVGKPVLREAEPEKSIWDYIVGFFAAIGLSQMYCTESAPFCPITE